MTVTDDELLIEWGVALEAFPGETESGDQYLVKSFDDGILVAVIDGLGHGEKAAVVAKKTVATLDVHEHESVEDLFKHAHKALRGTRGVVMSLASFERTTNRMSWLGVGNVKGVLVRANNSNSQMSNEVREGLLLRGGIVGYRLPSLYPATTLVHPNDTLVFATDGLKSDFLEGISFEGSAQRIADDIFAKHVRGTDDALVLVARYR